MASEIKVAGSSFRQFDVVTDYSDHHFAKAIQIETDTKSKTNTNCFANARSSVHKKIMHDWKILDESLPDTVYVRAYEGRIDLLRAVIIGAQGTPYHDGLFFFDIAFPYNYPDRPPMVHYHSFGLTLNPNLYANGTVCLSLLNTWHGSPSEMWNPNCSSILQVLVSIQALVLNEKPYYNEPGTRPDPKYMAYNEEVFALTCKAMHNTLRVPPCNFEEFVTMHFRQHGYNILNAIDAYRKGSARVGYYYQSSGKDRKQVSKVSVRFIENLDELYKLLFVDFSKIELSELDKLPPPTETVAKGTDMHGGSKKWRTLKSGKMKSVLGYLRSKVKNVIKLVTKKSS